MDLFSQNQPSEGRPLADLLRPNSPDEFVGQQKTIGPDSPLGKMLKRGAIPSLILWGPPGCGKTTLGRLLSQHLKAEFIARNAIDTGAKALRDLGTEAHRRRLEQQEQTLLFIDEIHRLNKSQQDVLLPHVERGDFTLVGATTENPSYELNPALLSRCRLVVFEKLAAADLQQLLGRGFHHYGLTAAQVLTAPAQDQLVRLADGDARRMLNSVEQMANLYQAFQNEPSEWQWPLDEASLSRALGAQPLYYDKDRDQHYDTISAFIKSIRGSDPNAALYYLARMLAGGENPLFIARRLVVLASEDVGNADPRALAVAVAGTQAVELVGLPECAINLAQVVTYLASAPKSNRSYEGLRQAQAEVERSGQLPIPLSLRSAQTKLAKSLGYGQDYQYSHVGERGWIDQQFLPDAIKEAQFYLPAERGFEKNIRQYLDWVKGVKGSTP